MRVFWREWSSYEVWFESILQRYESILQRVSKSCLKEYVEARISVSSSECQRTVYSKQSEKKDLEMRMAVAVCQGSFEQELIECKSRHASVGISPPS